MCNKYIKWDVDGRGWYKEGEFKTENSCMRLYTQDPKQNLNTCTKKGDNEGSWD